MNNNNDDIFFSIMEALENDNYSDEDYQQESPSFYEAMISQDFEESPIID